MMKSITKLLLSVVVLCWTVVTVIEATGTCPGKPHMMSSNIVSCTTSNGDLLTSHDCLAAQLSTPSQICNSNSSCAVMSVKVSDGSYLTNATAGHVWSYSSCFRQVMAVQICDQTATGTTVIPSTAPPSGMTTEESIDSSTDGLSSDGSVSGSLCATGTVLFDTPDCNVGEEANITLTMDSGDELMARVYVADCTIPEEPTPAPTPVSSDLYDCWLCSDSTCDMTISSSVKACGSCWTYILTEGDNTTITRGCLGDLDLTNSGYSDTTFCSDTYMSGVCSDVASGLQECLRCCSGAECNSHDLDTILLTDTPEDSGALTLVPSVTLLVLLHGVKSYLY